MSEEAIAINLLFGALTRPPMIKGVTLEYHAINLMFSMIAFIGLGSILYAGIFIPLHIFGWTVCRFDPNFFAIIQKKLSLPNIPNQAIWGVRSYEPF